MVKKSKRPPPPAPKAERLPAAFRRSQFVAAYLKTGDVTKSALAAGFSPKSAHSQGSRLLKDDRVKAEIDRVMRPAAKKLEITAERVAQELAKISFSDMRRAARWGKSLELVPSHELDDDTAAAISEVSLTKFGPKLKFYNKEAALHLLAKHTGLLADGPDISIPVTFIVERSERSRPRRPYEDDDAA